MTLIYKDYTEMQGQQNIKLNRYLRPEYQSQWPCGLRRRSAAARLLRSWVRIPPGVWIFVCCECCVLSGRGLCDELITRLEESNRLWCVVVCDLETSRMGRPWPALDHSATPQKKKSLSRIVAKYDLIFSPWTVKAKGTIYGDSTLMWVLRGLNKAGI